MKTIENLNFIVYLNLWILFCHTRSAYVCTVRETHFNFIPKRNSWNLFCAYEVFNLRRKFLWLANKSLYSYIYKFKYLSGNVFIENLIVMGKVNKNT